jgi:hypothetical protein
LARLRIRRRRLDCGHDVTCTSSAEHQHGQDLVEYALLTGAIGFAALLVFDVILAAIGNTYGSQVTAVDSIWESPAPAGGS